MILRRNERSARREVTSPTQNIDDNTSAANADKASAASSSWSPSKWVAGLMGRGEAPVAAATSPTEDAEDYVHITAAAASISTAAAARAAAANSTTSAAANQR